MIIKIFVQHGLRMTDYKSFSMIVSEDIKNRADRSSRELLRLPENREKWRQCVVEIIKAVDKKIEVLNEEMNNLRRIYSDFKVDPSGRIDSQIEKAERFRFHAEKKLAEVDRLIKLDADIDPELSLATFLRDAIKFHMQIKRDNNTFDGVDCMLWESLEGKWSF